MRRAVLKHFIILAVVALGISAVIFYFSASAVMLRAQRRDMEYTLWLLEQNAVTDDWQQKEGMHDVLEQYGGRITVIDRNGQVLMDTDGEAALLDNHLQRKEVQQAIQNGSGYAIRFSDTLQKQMLYVAVASSEDGCIYRMAIPYSGFAAYNRVLLGPLMAVVVLALVVSYWLARRFSFTITRPLQEIAGELAKLSDTANTLSFKSYPYVELNQIVQTTKTMEREIQDYITRLTKEKQIRQAFFSNASHELKTPLTSIRGYAELLEHGLVKDEAQRQLCLTHILKETDAMTRLIEDILMISRLESDEAEVIISDVAVDVVLREVVAALHPLADRQHVVVRTSCKPLVWRMAQQHLEQILSNVISNAIKYNKENGTVDVEILQQEDTLVIAVEDSGVGIAEANIERIFERFYRLDDGRSKKIGGTGLGLSIVKHIVQYHRGTIQVTSKVGVGTKMTIRLPQAGHDNGKEEMA